MIATRPVSDSIAIMEPSFDSHGFPPVPAIPSVDVTMVAAGGRVEQHEAVVEVDGDRQMVGLGEPDEERLQSLQIDAFGAVLGHSPELRAIVLDDVRGDEVTADRDARVADRDLGDRPRDRTVSAE